MANIKKIEEQDFVFVNKPLTEKEEKAFSDFIKAKKLRTKSKTRTSKGKNKQLV